MLKLFGVIFGKLIGKMSPEQKKEAWIKFNDLTKTLVQSAAAGAAEGMVKGMSDERNKPS